MSSLLSRLRRRLSFANVTSVLALFLALGGTSYAAASLAYNSVGKGQIRSNAVGKSEAATNSVGTAELRGSAVTAPDIKTSAVGPSEVRANAISSDEVQDGTLEAADLSAAAQSTINGVKFHSTVTAAGAQTAGNAKTVTKGAAGVYTIDLGTDVSKCQPVATVAGASAPSAFATVEPGASSNLLTVRTLDVPGAAPIDAPFNLLVAC